MKKKIATLVLMTVVMTTSIFATNIGVNVNTQVLTSFTSRFNDAKEVSWSKTDDYVKASFKLNEQVMFAYFAEDGELIGVSRNILSYQLPINLQTELRSLSSNGWITELFEYADETGTTYYVTIENADQKIQMKSVGYNEWLVSKKTKKS